MGRLLLLAMIARDSCARAPQPVLARAGRRVLLHGGAEQPLADNSQNHAPIEPGATRLRGLIDALLSLQCRTTAVVVILTLGVTAAVSGYLLKSSETLVRSQSDSQLVQMAATLASAASGMLAAGDRQGIKQLAEEAVRGKSLAYVVITDAAGGLVVQAKGEHADQLGSLVDESALGVPVRTRRIARQGSKEGRMFLDVAYPITAPANGPGDDTAGPNRRRLLGYVRTGVVAHSWHRTMASRMDLVTGVGILAMVVAIPIGFFLVRRIISPLDRIVDAMERFSRGDLRVRSEVRRRDEIGRLAATFNTMADQHQKTHERIVRLNAELEQRVATRTQQLRELASREPLTGLYNRRHFNEVLERSLSEAVRHQTDLSCVMIDLDGFKAVNDQFGHYVGDELLVLTAATISSQLRAADVAARFGGDEFILVLPQTDSGDALVLAQRIADQFSRDAARRLPQVRTSMSMGIASIPDSGLEVAQSLIRAADDALYAAKDAGKDRIVTHGRPLTAAKPAIL